MDIVNLISSLSLDDSAAPKEPGNLRVFAADVGHHTDIVFGEFSDKHLLIVTQFGKVGSLLKITVDLVDSNRVYTVNTVFGACDEQQEAAARLIAEKLDIRKPLLLFLSLKDYEKESVNKVVEVVVNPPQS